MLGKAIQARVAGGKASCEAKDHRGDAGLARRSPPPAEVNAAIVVEALIEQDEGAAACGIAAAVEAEEPQKEESVCGRVYVGV